MKHTDEFVLASLVERLGPQGAKQRLALEIGHWTEAIGQSLDWFRAAWWWSNQSLIEKVVRASGLYARGLRNAARLRLQRNELFFDELPEPFDGLTILHISDLHVELSAGAMQTMREQLRGI